MSKIKILDKYGNMLANDNARDLSSKAERVVLDLVKNSYSAYRRELDNWKVARMERLNVHDPYTNLLQDMYKDVMLDSHLTAICQHRILRVLNHDYVILDSKGVADYDRSDFIQKKWFTDLLNYAMQSIFFEYSCMLLKGEKEIEGVEIIPREHIHVERKEILRQVYDRRGLPIDKFPKDFLFAKLYDGIGLLEKAAPLTVLKRHSWSSWDEFEQIFGMPIRIAKLGSMSSKVKDEVAGWLEKMGTASYGIFPEFADIEIKESNNRDAFNVFFKKIETVDAQLSVLINGQTMTTSDGSSRSQAEIHEHTQDEITRADQKYLLNWINDELVPVLRMRGYPINENERIGIEEVTDPHERMKIDEKLMQNGYKLTKEYIESTYGVELDVVQTTEKKKPLA